MISKWHQLVAESELTRKFHRLLLNLWPTLYILSLLFVSCSTALVLHLCWLWSCFLVNAWQHLGLSPIGLSFTTFIISVFFRVLLQNSPSQGWCCLCFQFHPIIVWHFCVRAYLEPRFVSKGFCLLADILRVGYIQEWWHTLHHVNGLQ